MNISIIYEDNDVLVIDKPPGIVVFSEWKTKENESIGVSDIPIGVGMSETPILSLVDVLLEKYPDLKNVGEAPRYGIVHRLDKDTSGILLIAKTPESLIFLQKQFKNREVVKKYTALATGSINEDKGIIHTLIGRSKSDPRKQKATWLKDSNPKGKREAISEYKVIKRFQDPSTSLKTSYTLLEVQIKTGRKHQIRAHMAYIHHPIAGDKMYGFKDSPRPKGLERQFLHASYLKIKLPDGQTKEFRSDLPEELLRILKGLAPRA